MPVVFIASQLDSERAFGERRALEPTELLTGFLTMLMTDVEDSSGLVERLGEQYRELIGGVRRLLRETAAAFAGQAVETRADEFFAVFESPGSALEASIAVQRELRERSWTDGAEVRVRIGIHSGYPTRDEVNYTGLAIHTTARVCAAAHGGQVIVSGDTKEASLGQRPVGLRFVSLGEHRLRGIPKAVQLFQAAAKGLPLRFPPPRTATRSRDGRPAG
ncbi:MAG TPA: adenylate/guanylate cyclase domain-containing protein [Microthrixaceae bacterium]|nr:adenylate/guanylate cyclase domain-containing protein [Microthrixaceae bacterium]